MEFTGIKIQYKLNKHELDQAIQDVLNECAFIMGPQIQELEEALAQYVKVKHCIGVSSGTSSLQMAMMALGIGPGDEVITVPFTWIATAESIAIIGATPVFVDIDPETYLMDLNQLEAAITPRTKAIMPVSLFGQMPDFSKINALAKKHGIAVIEDGAQSFGATQDGKLSCSLTTIASTSFFPTKPLGCYGDGGALFTNDDELAQKIKMLRTHGSVNREDHYYVGMNGRLDTIQAAILKVKLPKFPDEVKARNEKGRYYSELLKNYCQTPRIAENNTHVYAQYTLRSPHRDKILQALNHHHIPARIFYPKCIHEQPSFAYRGYKKGSLPVAEKACKEVLSIPMHPWITEDEQNKVASVIIDAVNG